METDRATGDFAVSEKSRAFAVDFDDDAQVTAAVRRAVANALRTHKEKGWYMVDCGEDGKPVRVEPEDIVVPGVESVESPEAAA